MLASMSTRVVLDGLTFGEGPRWHDGRLFVSDFFDHRVLALSPEGDVETIVHVPEQPSGLGWDPEGRLHVVSMKDRRLLRLGDDGLEVNAEFGDIYEEDRRSIAQFVRDMRLLKDEIRSEGSE